MFKKKRVFSQLNGKKWPVLLNKLTKSAFWVTQKEKKNANRLTWNKNDILWNLLKIRWKADTQKVMEQKHSLHRTHSKSVQFLILIIKWKAILILFALFIRNSCCSIDFSFIFMLQAFLLCCFFYCLFVFNRVKSVWVILFIFCHFDKSAISTLYYTLFICIMLTYIRFFFFLFHFHFVLSSVCLILFCYAQHINDPLPFHFHMNSILYIYNSFSDKCVLLLFCFFSRFASSKLCFSHNPCLSFSHHRPLGMRSIYTEICMNGTLNWEIKM